MSSSIPYGASGGAHGQPLMPPTKIGENNRTSGFDYPMFSFSNGGSYVATPLDSDNLGGSTFSLRDTTGVVFSVSLTNINTALTLTLTHWNGLYWYDSGNSLYYVLVMDNATANRIYLVTISLTGTIALVGSDTIANWSAGASPSINTHQAGWTRVTQNSGDFSIYHSLNKTVISSTTGLVVTTDTSFSLVGATATVLDTPRYITEDGKIAIGTPIVGDSSGFNIARKDSNGVLTAEILMATTAEDMATDWQKLKFIKWDGVVILGASPNTASAGITILGQRQWEIAEFDAWLHDMCDYLGISEI